MRAFLTITFCLFHFATCRAAVAAPGPQTAPADRLLAEASAAVTAGTLGDFGKSVETRLEPLLADQNLTDPAQLVRLTALREMSRYFGRVERPDDLGRQTLLWLLEHPRLLDTLMLAVGEDDAPDRVLAVLTALRLEHGAKLADFPDLTTALCVVWDTPLSMNDENLRAEIERPPWLFRYLTGARKRLRFDPQSLPWELSAYVVDNVVSPDEVAWAVARYGNRGAIGGAYFDVPYDFAVLYSGAEKRIGGREYTLANLVRYGGICGDQAYLASNVARSLGVPACTSVGLGGAMEGTAHAWVGFLETRGADANVGWNFSEGRYPEHQYWRGMVQDPQTRGPVTDSDVMLLAELARTPPQDRLASVALCKASDLVEPARAAELFTRAINLSPGNRDAWLRLAKLGADRKLGDRQMQQAMQVVAKFAAKSYPDFAFAILRQLNSGRGTEQQMRALKDARGLFRQRPDLQAAIRLAEGDLLRDQEQHAAALAAYGDVLRQYHNAGPIVLAALEKTESLLRDHDDLARLAKIYGEVWQRLPQPPTSGYARSTPYFIVGQKYLNLLDEIGKTAEAARVQTRLNSLSMGKNR